MSFSGRFFSSLPAFLMVACDIFDSDTDAGFPATEGTLDVAFDLESSGTGSDRVGNIDLAGSTGILTLDGVGHQAVAYQDHDWSSETGYHLYDLISIADDGSNLAVSYLYCSGSSLEHVYTESFLHPLDAEGASGSCDAVAAPFEAEVALPALTVLPDPIDLGITIDGADVSLAGSTGSVTLEGVDREWLPFASVDCSDCPGGPWYEIHGLAVGPDDACFTIGYLFPDDPTYVQFAYSICLPSLDRPDDISLNASWEGEFNNAGSARRVSPPHRPLPPGR